MPKRMVFDRWLFFAVGALAIFGLFMVGSASNYEGMNSLESASGYLIKHLIFLFAGFAGLVAALSFPYQKLSSRTLVLGSVLLTTAGLVLVLAMPTRGGAHRWLFAGPVQIQPSEIAKLAIVLFMAWMLSRKDERVNEFQAVCLPSLLVVGLICGLVVIEPDLGTALIIGATAFVMIFVAGLGWRWIAGASALGVLGVIAAIAAEPYRLQRIDAFLNPGTQLLGTNFQLNQSLIAIGSGGLMGQGLGQGQQKAFYLFGAHTDFIYSVIGEELGFVGTIGLLLTFLLIFWRGIRAAWRAPDRFGFYLALGVTSLIVMQFFVHIGVCVGLLPTKGLSLPLVSYGGSSLVVSMTGIGVLLNVSQHSN
jgi:cell division protein FtsW